MVQIRDLGAHLRGELGRQRHHGVRVFHRSQRDRMMFKCARRQHEKAMSDEECIGESGRGRPKPV